MKSVLISIQPKWYEKIANGEKTIELRKTRPKLETPFKCYIYCTKDNKTAFNNHNGNMFLSPKGWQDYSECNGKVIGEFICNKIDEYTAEFVNDGDCYEDIRRRWIDDDGEEDFEIITSNDRDNPEDCELLKNSCLSYAELKKYIGENFHDIHFYGWHISDLVIYDKPKELSEFGRKCDYASEIHCRDCLILGDWDSCCGVMCKPLTRPPQSYMYVEEI